MFRSEYYKINYLLSGSSYELTPKLVKRCKCIPHMEPDAWPLLFTIYSNENCSAKAKEYEGGGKWLCEEHTETYGFDVTIHPNDGIVLAESQRELPYMTLKEDVDPKEDLRMESSSHMQVRNNGALKEKLYLLYNGEYDLFFKTEERD